MDIVVENAKMEDLKTLIKKMVKVMEAVQSIPKNGVHQHFNYKYCTDNDVLENLRTAMVKNGIFMLTSIEEVNMREAESKGEKSVAVVRVRTKHTFFDAESGASLVCHSAGESQDQDFKGLCKAFTYSVKYILIKNFLVPAEHDPEGNGQAGGKNKPHGNKSQGQQGSNGQAEQLTIGTIMNLFQSLGMKKINAAHYRAYLKDKYKIDSPEKMPPEQLKEQRDMLESLKANEGGESGYQIGHFEAHLFEKFSDKKG